MNTLNSYFVPLAVRVEQLIHIIYYDSSLWKGETENILLSCELWAWNGVFQFIGIDYIYAYYSIWKLDWTQADGSAFSTE